MYASLDDVVVRQVENHVGLNVFSTIALIIALEIDTSGRSLVRCNIVILMKGARLQCRIVQSVVP